MNAAVRFMMDGAKVLLGCSFQELLLLKNFKPAANILFWTVNRNIPLAVCWLKRIDQLE